MQEGKSLDLFSALLWGEKVPDTYLMSVQDHSMDCWQYCHYRHSAPFIQIRWRLLGDSTWTVASIESVLTDTNVAVVVECWPYTFLLNGVDPQEYKQLCEANKTMREVAAMQREDEGFVLISDPLLPSTPTAGPVHP